MAEVKDLNVNILCISDSSLTTPSGIGTRYFDAAMEYSPLARIRPRCALT